MTVTHIDERTWLEAHMDDAIRDALLSYESQRFCYVQAFRFYHPPSVEAGWDHRAETLAVRGKAYGE